MPAIGIYRTRRRPWISGNGSHQVQGALNNSCRARHQVYARALLVVQHFRDEACSLARCPASRRPDSRRGFMRPPSERYHDAKIDRTFVPSCEPTERERYGKREKGKKRRKTRSCRMVGILPSQMAMTTTYFPRPGISRYVSRLPSASMVLSTLQKSLSTCCLSVSPAFYIRECWIWIFSVATSFYAFNIIKCGITEKSRHDLLIKSCDNQQYI